MTKRFLRSDGGARKLEDFLAKDLPLNLPTPDESPPTRSTRTPRR